MSLRSLKFKERNLVVREFYLKNHDKKKAYTANHFLGNHGMKKTALYRIMERVDEDDDVENMERREGSGRP